MDRFGDTVDDARHRRRHRSRSPAMASAEDGRRRQRRGSHTRDDERDPVPKSGSTRKSYDERDRKRRRSRSPRHDSSQLHYDSLDTKHKYRDDRSPEPRSRRERGSRPPKDISNDVSIKRSGPLPSQEASFSQIKGSSEVVLHDGKPLPDKEKPNFAPTGLLAAASNSVAAADGTSIVLKYHEPPEARKPPKRDEWRLFVFKGADIVDTVELSLRSCWLIGRELAVVDLPAEHPSISKQHAVIQFRFVEKKNEFGDKIGKVKPYLIDLESANGTMLNKEPIPPSRYLELRDKDMIQFGESTREYVLMLPPKE